MAGIVVVAIGLLAGCTASYGWTFGDGETSDDPSPVHVYRAAGTYTVGLTAESTDGSIVQEEKADLITASVVARKTAGTDYI